MHKPRRQILKHLVATLFGVALLPLNAMAALWNKAAFEAIGNRQALNGLQVNSETPSEQIEIIAPKYAENGAVVQIEVYSHIAGTEAIAILVDKNPTALIANYTFGLGVVPRVVTRIKMAETSSVQAVVKVGGQYFTASKHVEVSVGGCG